MLASGALLTLFGAVFLTYLVRNQFGYEREELKQRLVHELDYLVPTIAEPALVGDYALIQEMLKVRVDQPAIRDVQWTDTRGNALSATSAELPRVAPRWFARLVQFPSYHASRNIIVGGELYGEVSFTLTSTPAENRIWEAFLEYLVALVLANVAMFGITLAIVTNGLRPLYALGAAARRFGDGERFERLAPIGPPEMAACVRAFNGMATNIEDLVHSLRESNTRSRLLATIAEQSSAAIVTKDLDGIITSWNPAAAAMFGYSSEEATGKPASIMLPPGRQDRFGDVVSRINAGQPSYHFEQTHIARSGKTLVTASSVAPLYHDDGTHIGEISVIRDITPQKEAEEALFREKERAQVTLASIADAVITTDMAGNVEYLNPVAEALTGWRASEAHGYPLAQVFCVSSETDEPIENPVAKVLRDNRAMEVSDHAVLASRTGHRLPIQDSAAPIRNRDGSTVGAVLVFRDVSASRKMAQELAWQASHDALTGLVNRREFERRLDTLVKSAHTEQRDHALLYIDLDQFKVVNDTCGHIAGDALLCQLSPLLALRVRGTDTLARLGGDEFAVLLPDCTLEQAIVVGEALREVTANLRFNCEGNLFSIGASVGAVAITRGYQTSSDILNTADAACYEAKETGGNRVQAWRPDDEELSRRRGEMLWVSRINHAVQGNQFVLHAQRIMTIQRDDHDTGHYEVLLRMIDADGTLVYPMAFIPAAERYNLMRTIDRKVISLVFEALDERERAGFADETFTVSINLSGDSLSDERLLQFLREQFARHRVKPERICFEVTETAAIANLGRAARMINELKALGCEFSLDDFGSGLSSFRYLKDLPVDYLKIDGNFVRDMARNPIDAAMVGAINNVGHVMGIRTIAEWVEDDETLAMLRDIGVDYAQGYGVERPVPLANIRPQFARCLPAAERAGAVAGTT
jgi:diguanylate cyclase (GGDEF)-like protein/PAS domain S-box-containing protein